MENLLKYEDSPYLQHHKNNPIHWFPWSDAAFLKASTENKPIFISIGYSSCHWCHVMEHEVFENEILAKRLNEHFVCIKVDKEERPDIDKFYQEVHMILNRRTGGWPTSIFSTPDNKPFFAGTYIAPLSQNQTMGFVDLINIIAMKVSQKDTVLYDNAEEIQKYLKPSTRPLQATLLNETIISTFMKQCQHNFDENFGGFGKYPKFPQTSTLKSLLDISILNQDNTALHMLTHTLDSMLQGGFYDLVESGFSRYSTDAAWRIPHFEKMTYDNALIIELLVHTFKATKNTKYLNFAKDTTDFMLKNMSQDHLFYSSSDADNNGVEGEYFTYNHEDTLEYFKDHGFKEYDALEIFTKLHITPLGNCDGSSILYIEGEDRPKNYDKAIKLLAEIRSNRDHPFIDTKIITSWNSMMIKSLFLLSNYDENYKKMALSHLDALVSKAYIQGTLFHTSIIGSHPKITAFLEDYAYLSTALIQAYESTLEQDYLNLAHELCDTAIKEFYEDGKWLFSKGEFLTDADIADSSYPGSVSVMIDALLSLSMLVDEKYRHIAFISLQYHSIILVKKPVRYPHLFNMALRYIKEDRVIKGSIESLNTLQDAYFKLTYPFLSRHATTNTETLLCGVQSCYSSLTKDSDLNEELQKTLKGTSNGA